MREIKMGLDGQDSQAAESCALHSNRVCLLCISKHVLVCHFCIFCSMRQFIRAAKLAIHMLCAGQRLCLLKPGQEMQGLLIEATCIVEREHLHRVVASDHT